MAPIIGAPDAIAKQIQQEFTSAVEKQRVSVTSGKDERADYTLRGYIVAAKDKSATKVSYIWDVTDPTGKRVNRITGEEVVSGQCRQGPVGGPDAAGRAIDRRQGRQLLRCLAADARAARGHWPPTSRRSPRASARNRQRRRASPNARPLPSSPRPHNAGADDGQHRPRRAGAGRRAGCRRRARRRQHVAHGRHSARAVGQGRGGHGPADRPSPIGSKARSRSARPKDGKQPIHIEWLVRDPQGKKLGTVSQKNEIPEGSLDGPWEKTAEQAAGAAAQGIVKLLPQPRPSTRGLVTCDRAAPASCGGGRSALCGGWPALQPVYKTRRRLLEGAAVSTECRRCPSIRETRAATGQRRWI